MDRHATIPAADPGRPALGRLVDLPGAMARTGEATGLVLYERNVALLAGLRDDTLVPRASFFALEQVRRARAAGVGRQVIAHEDLLVFRPARKPAASGQRDGSASGRPAVGRPGRRPRRGRVTLPPGGRPSTPIGRRLAEGLDLSGRLWPPPQGHARRTTPPAPHGPYRPLPTAPMELPDGPRRR